MRKRRGVDVPADAEFSRSLQVRDGPTLFTLANAGRFISGRLTEVDQHRQSWIRAVELLLDAAEHDGSIEAATDQVEVALFISGMLDLSK